jgi:L-2-hydroxyglutarate oxidase LhgO
MASPAAAAAAVASVEKVGGTVVIGAGVIGLAIARSLVQHPQNRGRDDVLLLERNDRMGAETSSRHSEVVHGGLYYPTNSLKAKFCVQGRRMLYDFCETHDVPYNKVGKLVVATITASAPDSQTIRTLHDQACRNGYHDTRILTPEDVACIEPSVKCNGGALWSPETGIVDSHNFMLSLLADAEQQSSSLSSCASGSLSLALCTPVKKARIVVNNDFTNNSSHQRPRVQLFAGGMWLQPDSVVNAAGLWADDVARLIHDNNHDENEQQQQQQQPQEQQRWKPPRQYYARGSYFQLNVKSPFSHLIYPVPDQRGGLGEFVVSCTYSFLIQNCLKNSCLGVYY